MSQRFFYLLAFSGFVPHSERRSEQLRRSKGWRSTFSESHLFLRQGVFVRLREHPLMSHSGHSSWPPRWTWMSGRYSTVPDGEAGVLENARMSSVNQTAMFLTMSHVGGFYVSRLYFDDAEFCERICNLLKHNFGSSMRTIGDLEIL